MSDCDTTSHKDSDASSMNRTWSGDHHSFAAYSFGGPADSSFLGTTPTLQGLGLDFQSPAQDLPSLLQLIGGYERAVGRAFLHQQSLLKTMPQSSPIHNPLGDLQTAHAFGDYKDDSNAPPALSTSTTPMTEQGHFSWASPTLQNPPSWPYQTTANHSLPNLSYQDDLWRSPEIASSPLEPTHQFSHMTDLDYSLQTASIAMNAEYLDSRALSPQPNDMLKHKQAQYLDSPSTSSQTDSGIAFSDASDAETRSVTASSPTMRQPLKRAYTDSTLTNLQAEESSQRAWTTELDDMLRAEVQRQREAGDVPLPWTKIARRIGKRSGVQCQARWAEVLDEKIRKGRWNASEDASLRQLYKKHGGQWSKIASEMTTRTQRQCRSRWLQMNGSAAFA